MKKQLKKNSLSALFSLIAGLVLLLLNIYLVPHSIEYIQSLLDIVSWVFVWTAVESFFLERTLLKLEQLLALRMVTAKVEVHDFIPKWARTQNSVPNENDENTISV